MPISRPHRRCRAGPQCRQGAAHALNLDRLAHGVAGGAGDLGDDRRLEPASRSSGSTCRHSAGRSAPPSGLRAAARPASPAPALPEGWRRCIEPAEGIGIAQKSISSSGKSSVASTSMRRRVNCSTSSAIRAEKAPESERTAERAASVDAASIRSATASACARSSLPLRNARRENSPARPGARRVRCSAQG